MRIAIRGLAPSKFSLFGGDRLPAVDRERVDQALAISRLGGRRNVIVSELSYGEQRQLEIAMALVMHPRLLLLDEPAAGLSATERTYVAEILSALPRDLTMVLIEHDMELALRLVDFVTVMFNGRVLVEGGRNVPARRLPAVDRFPRRRSGTTSIRAYRQSAGAGCAAPAHPSSAHTRLHCVGRAHSHRR